MADNPKSILALDVGAKRVGVALASRVVRLAQPLTTLTYDEDKNFFEALEKIVLSEEVDTLVVGYPRGLQGQHTAQTEVIEQFAKRLNEHFALPVHFQDEALTSRRAQDELQARGKAYDRGAIDALAATYILEDWLAEHAELTEASA